MKLNRPFQRLKKGTSSFAIAMLLASAALAWAEPIGYVTRQDTAEVRVVDLATGAVLGAIPTLGPSPFEIALSPDTSTLYVTDVGDGSVKVLDVASRSPLQSIAIGLVPIEATLLPDGSKLYTADWIAGTVSVVDTVSRTNVATIPTAFLSYDVAASPDGSRVYATALTTPQLFVIDTTLNAVVDRIPTGATLSGHVAIAPDGLKAYVTDFLNRVIVIDLAARSVIGAIPFNAAGANPNNGALDIAIDLQGAFAYVLGFDTVNKIDLATNALVATVPIGIQVSDVVIDSTGAFVYVTTLHQDLALVPLNELVKINAGSFAITDRFVIGGLLVGLAAGPSALQVVIDVKPGGFPNSINLKSKGVVPVAVLGSPRFGVIDVDVYQVTFAGASPQHFGYEDVNLDGISDLIFHFPTENLQLTGASTEATLNGKLRNGMTFTGTDSVRVVPTIGRAGNL